MLIFFDKLTEREKQNVNYVNNTQKQNEKPQKRKKTVCYFDDKLTYQMLLKVFLGMKYKHKWKFMKIL